MVSTQILRPDPPIPPGGRRIVTYPRFPSACSENQTPWPGLRNTVMAWQWGIHARHSQGRRAHCSRWGDPISAARQLSIYVIVSWGGQNVTECCTDSALIPHTRWVTLSVMQVLQQWHLAKVCGLLAANWWELQAEFGGHEFGSYWSNFKTVSRKMNEYYPQDWENQFIGKMGITCYCITGFTSLTGSIFRQCNARYANVTTVTPRKTCTGGIVYTQSTSWIPIGNQLVTCNRAIYNWDKKVLTIHRVCPWCQHVGQLVSFGCNARYAWLMTQLQGDGMIFENQVCGI